MSPHVARGGLRPLMTTPVQPWPRSLAEGSAALVRPVFSPEPTGRWGCCPTYLTAPPVMGLKNEVTGAVKACRVVAKDRTTSQRVDYGPPKLHTSTKLTPVLPLPQATRKPYSVTSGLRLSSCSQARRLRYCTL